jgi:alkanesulfonate monooxygenase SsuD/methylene tetrahydromethanopterin reductase-like flavin-dependent oxidoreductase (luciferase family)
VSEVRFGLTPWATDDADANMASELPESHFAPRGAYPAPLLLLAAAAARTKQLRLGTTSYLLPVRHPLQVAEEVGVLEQLSSGRVILGVGRGFQPILFEAFEVPAAEKRDRFEAALEVILRAWRGEPVGPGSDTRVNPLPRQEPHPPIWVAAFGPKALRQAGRLNLPYLASPLEPLARLIENHTIHREARPHGRDEPLAVPVIRTVLVTRNPACSQRVCAALEDQAQRIAREGGPTLRRAASVEVPRWALIGEPEQVADKIEEYRNAIGLTHVIARGAVPGASPQELDESVHLLAELSERFRA